MADIVQQKNSVFTERVKQQPKTILNPFHRDNSQIGKNSRKKKSFNLIVKTKKECEGRYILRQKIKPGYDGKKKIKPGYKGKKKNLDVKASKKSKLDI